MLDLHYILLSFKSQSAPNCIDSLCLSADQARLELDINRDIAVDVDVVLLSLLFTFSQQAASMETSVCSTSLDAHARCLTPFEPASRSECKMASERAGRWRGAGSEKKWRQASIAEPLDLALVWQKVTARGKDTNSLCR